jgi:transcriptional regulator with XRE-family HTH domain
VRIIADVTNEEIVESVGERIRALRGDRTIEVMAERADVQWNTWWRYEAGIIKPSLLKLAKIATALEVKICLFEEDEAA